MEKPELAFQRKVVADFRTQQAKESEASNIMVMDDEGEQRDQDTTKSGGKKRVVVMDDDEGER